MVVWTTYYCGIGLRHVARFHRLPQLWEIFGESSVPGSWLASLEDTILCKPPIPADCDLGNTTGSGIPVVIVTLQPIGSPRSWLALVNTASKRVVDPESTADMTVRAPHDPSEHGKCWLEQRLCENQRVRRNQQLNTVGDGSIETPGINSIVWTLDTEYVGTRQSREAWEWLSATTSPEFRVVYFEQNPLDVILTLLHDKGLTPTCSGDACRGEGADFTIPLALVVELLDQLTRGQESFRQLLNQLSVPYARFTSDRLGMEENGIELIRLLRFLEDDSSSTTTEFTPEHLFQWMGSRSTRTAASGVTALKGASNYEEVVEALQGSRFGHMLEQMLEPSTRMGAEPL